MHDSPQAKHEALAVGADAFLTKTASTGTLIRTVTALLDTRFQEG
jgi:DNA-binding NarL/FixJ family response regulator